MMRLRWTVGCILPACCTMEDGYLLARSRRLALFAYREPLFSRLPILSRRHCGASAPLPLEATEMRDTVGRGRQPTV
jgi:hypothetical protein